MNSFKNILQATLLGGVLLSTSLSAAFVTTWETNTSSQTLEIGVSIDENQTFNHIQDEGEANETVIYDYHTMLISWGDGSADTNFTSRDTYPTHTYSDIGSYEIKIQSTNDANMSLELGATDSKEFLKSFDSWSDGNGSEQFTSFEKAFYNCSTLDYNATDVPDFTDANSTANMFNGIKSISGDISGWNTSNIVDMNNMFAGLKEFNQTLSSWDVSSVIDMSRMFNGIDELNVSSIKVWNISSVTNLSDMFSDSSFNEDLSTWNISSNANMEGLFKNTFLSQENLLAILASWVAQGDTNTSVDIGRKATLYVLENNETNRTISIDDNSVTIFKDTAYYSDYNYTIIAPFLKSLITDQNWTIYENGLEFSALSLMPQSTLSTIEDFEDITQIISVRGSVDDRNNTRLITYSVDINDTNLLDFNLSNNSIVFSSIKDKFGIVRVDYNVSDGYFSDTAYFDFNISNVDDNPSIDTNITLQGTNLTLAYDANYNSYTIEGLLEDSAAFTFDINITDVDGDNINYTIESYDTNIVTVVIDQSGRATVTPISNASGRVKIAIKATANSRSVTQSYWLNILGSNDAPTIDFISLTDISIVEDNGTTLFDINISDVDGDDLNLSIESNNTLLINVAKSWDGILNTASYSNSALDFNLTTVKDAHGIARVTVTLSDEINSTIQTFDIDVTSVYDEFSIAPIADKIKEKNFSSFVINMDVSDGDVIGDIEYSAVYDTSKVTVEINATSKVLKITPIINAIGKTDVNITALYRAQNDTVTVDFKIDIVDTSAEDLPIYKEINGEKSYSSRFETLIRSDVNASNSIDGTISSLVFETAELNMSVLGKASASLAGIELESDLNATDTLLTKRNGLVQLITTYADTKITMKDDNSTVLQKQNSEVSAALSGTKTLIKDNGEVEMQSGDAVVLIKSDGSILTEFKNVANAVSFKTAYPNGTRTEIKMIDGQKFIKTRTSLDENLVAE